MAQLVQGHTGEKKYREQSNGQLNISCEDQQNRLYLTMQKPLEKDQRHEHEEEPEKARERHGCRHWIMDGLWSTVHGLQLGSFCDRRELIHFQAGSADESAVNIGLAEELSRIG